MNPIVILSAEAARLRTFPYRYAHIAIRDRGAAWYPQSVDPNRIALLHLEFDDERGAGRPNSPTAADVAPIVPFVLEWRERVEGFVVNCMAGISRSAGVAAGISPLLGLDERLAYQPPHNPNPLVRVLVLGGSTMRLTELEPQLIVRTENGWRGTGHIPEADGLSLLCPFCFEANGGSVGTHTIICWRPRVPPEVKPGPGRWEIIATCWDDMSLVAGSSSVFLTSAPCRAHFTIANGEIIFHREPS